ncbi:hypothetical protein AWB75_06662 [Caballeronia catudaia]|uniref:Uncharacterized protein n=1 Tax=Caballeronia catudaia TaxID=1777136 RepID=A0A158DFK8_9BURK|nr:hypothetical protein AWB75_06662 [Caballeronia catudaia]
MQVTGMLHGAKMLQFVGFPTPEILGADASEEQIRNMLMKHGMIFIKPVSKVASARKAKRASSGGRLTSQPLLQKRSACTSSSIAWETSSPRPME